MDRDRYRRWFAGIVLAAAVWRILYVLVFKSDDDLVGDQIYYSAQAVTIANGEGFADPAVPGAYAADHAPLTALVMAPVSWNDTDPALPQRLLMTVFGVAVVAGVGAVARWLTDRSTSLLATAIAAVYANLWMNDGLVMAETLAALAVVALLFITYRFDLSRSRRDALLMGVAVGVAGLARSELLLLGPLMVLPMTLFGDRAPAERSRRIGHLAVASAAALLVISPWVIRNQVRFDETVTMSTQDGLTLIGTNCPAAYEGSGRGFWHLSCAFDVAVPDDADQSTRSMLYRDAAFDFMGDNLDQLPSVVTVRLGLGLGFWKTSAMGYLNLGEGRERLASQIGLWQYWVLLPFAAYGLFRWPVEQRRWPMGALIIMSLLTIAALYGIPRFRIAAEVAIVICAAIGAMDLWRRRATSRAAIR